MFVIGWWPSYGDHPKHLGWSYICEYSQHTKSQPPTLPRSGLKKFGHNKQTNMVEPLMENSKKIGKIFGWLLYHLNDYFNLRTELRNRFKVVFKYHKGMCIVYVTIFSSSKWYNDGRGYFCLSLILPPITFQYITLSYDIILYFCII